MKLTCNLPINCDIENIVYSAQLDLTLDGRFTKDGFLAVTDRDVIVMYENKKKIYPISEISDIKCEPLIGTGIITINSPSQLIARFTSKQIARFSYIARGISELQNHSGKRIVSFERETTCEKCGRALPGTNKCFRCGSRMPMFKKIADIASPYKIKFLLLFLVMLVSTAAGLYIQHIEKNFINNHLETQSGTARDIFAFVASLVVCFAVIIITNTIRSYYSVKLGSKISLDLRTKLYDKIQSLSLSFIDRRQTGELMNRISGDTSKIREFMEQGFAGMFSCILTMAGALTIMLTMDPLMTLGSVVFVPLVIFFVRVWRKKMHRIFRSQNRKDDKLNNQLQDTLSGMRVVKSFGTEQRESEKFKALNIDLAETQTRNELFWSTFYPFLTFVMGCGIYFVTYFGGISVLDGRFRIGDFTQFVAYAGMLYGPLGWIAHLPRMIMRTMTSVERISDVMDEQPEVYSKETAQSHELEQSLEFKNVSFGYKPYEPVLTDISFTARKGEMIGIVGSSGTGKSTLINLIMRLYNVNEGEILMDGINISDLSTECLHKQIGVVLQETFLFTSTILNNIRFAKPDATLEEVIAAAKTANAHDFISKFPDGYNTLVGERGQTLSGGEKQRVAIARAILNDPKILILDEATSNLDTESESQIQEALSRLIEGRTTFAIAHRLSTLRNSTRLLVIDEHRIAEIGTHSELIAKKGIYYGLVVAQMQMNQVKNSAEASV